jgi:lipoate-protein ligase A
MTCPSEPGRFSVWRVLVDPPLDGPSNMARDEALLRAAEAGGSPPTLRFYRWSPPTISLGYFQDPAELAPAAPESPDLPVVRRTTGGGAILHDAEVTYALVLTTSHPLLAEGTTALYRMAHRAVIEAIGPAARLAGGELDARGESSRRGPFFCFARRHALDVLLRAPSGSLGKVAGSAQRRTQRAVLQHGSIILHNRFADHPAAGWASLPDGPRNFDLALRRLLPCFERSLGSVLRDGEWAPGELVAAARLHEQYAGLGWTLRRDRMAAG